MAISDDTRKHIEAERKESILMVSKLARTLGKVENAGVVLAKAFEWPRGASGWAQRQVKDLAKSMPFKCIFDGCRYDRRRRAGGLIQEPWEVRTTYTSAVGGALEPAV